MSEFKIKSYLNKGDQTQEELHIHKKRDGGCNINLTVNAFKYQDKETHQYIVFIPSLDISGYGETKKKAEEMIKFSLKDYCDYLYTLTAKNIEKELTGLGWKHSKLKNKDYSRAYVDLTGDLKGFAVNESVEQEMITA